MADNKIAELGGWLRTDLAIELSELAPLLEESGLDIELTGFQPFELDALMGDLVDPEQEPTEEALAIAGEPVSRRGDLWQLGSHRILCGDATNADDLHNLIGRERAMMVFTDPPYNVKIKSVQGRGKIKHREFAQASGEMSREQFTKFLVDSLSLAAQHSTDGSIHFVCMDWRHIRELQDAGEQVYTELKNVVVWVKTNSGMGTFYRSQHELIFVFRKGGGIQAHAKTSEEAGHHSSHHRDRQAPILRFCAARTWCCVASRHRSLEE